MKLHEAIRKNGWPQCTGRYFKRRLVPEVGVMATEIVAACALGQAYLNIFPDVAPDDDDDLVFELNKKYPFLYGKEAICPICEDAHGHCSEVIVHLNDLHGWTLSQIADWVQTVEEGQ